MQHFARLGIFYIFVVGLMWNKNLSAELKVQFLTAQSATYTYLFSNLGNIIPLC